MKKSKLKAPIPTPFFYWLESGFNLLNMLVFIACTVLYNTTQFLQKHNKTGFVSNSIVRFKADFLQRR
jgi:hypothetical protein